MNKKLGSFGFFVVLIISLFISTTANAQQDDPHVYFSINVGNVDYSDANSLISDLEAELASLGFSSTFDYDDSDSGLRLTGGFQASENVAITLSYVDLGKFAFDGVATIGPDIINIDNATVETSGLEFGLLFSMITPGSNFVPYGRFGLYMWDADFKFTVSSPTLGGPPQRVSESDDGTDIVFGFGAHYFLGDNVGIGLSWDRYDLDGTDIQFMSASLVFKN